ncbi:hypothetical protein B4098_2978 [Heyndrickxia coagulans]|uniref:Uncharacterized protein n=1 Tax=Heyndrickxia coagulans TaxID=1398 RepID=A0A150JVF1_HEYCO|nr:hypothetical protein B4098_2978 [Heyndrickxia coagulans]
MQICTQDEARPALSKFAGEERGLKKAHPRLDAPFSLIYK